MSYRSIWFCAYLVVVIVSSLSSLSCINIKKKIDVKPGVAPYEMSGRIIQKVSVSDPGTGVPGISVEFSQGKNPPTPVASGTDGHWSQIRFANDTYTIRPVSPFYDFYRRLDGSSTWVRVVAPVSITVNNNLTGIDFEVLDAGTALNFLSPNGGGTVEFAGRTVPITFNLAGSSGNEVTIYYRDREATEIWTQITILDISSTSSFLQSTINEPGFIEYTWTGWAPPAVMTACQIRVESAQHPHLLSGRSASVFPVVQSGSIEGEITFESSPMSDVLVQFFRDAQLVTTTNTGADGSYSSGGLEPADYRVQPVEPGYIFSPVSRTVSVTSGNIVPADFGAAPADTSITLTRPLDNEKYFPGAEFTVSYVTSGLAGKNVRIEYYDGSTTSVIAANVPVIEDGTQPTLSHTSLRAPATGGLTGLKIIITATHNPAVSVQHSNGFGTYALATLSGVVTLGSASPLNNVALTLLGPGVAGPNIERTATTGTDGAFSFLNTVQDTGRYTLFPTLAGYVFNPASVEATGAGTTPIIRNFEATPVGTMASIVSPVSGQIFYPGASFSIVFIANQLAGMHVSIEYDDGSGYQSLETNWLVPNDGLCAYPTIQASPADQDAALRVRVACVEYPAVETVSEFRTYRLSSVSGSATVDNGDPMIGAQVTLQGPGATGANVRFTTTTDASGDYQFDEIAQVGHYSIYLSKTGYEISPASYEIDILEDTDRTSLDFTGNIIGAFLSILSPIGGTHPALKPTDIEFTTANLCRNGPSNVIVEYWNGTSWIGITTTCINADGYHTIAWSMPNAMATPMNGLQIRARSVQIPSALGTGNAFNVTNIPPAPSDLVATFVNTFGVERRVYLNWVDNSWNERTFEIERSEDGGAYRKIRISLANISQFKDSLTSPNTNYMYRVRAISSHTHSSWIYSESVSVPQWKDVYLGLGAYEIYSVAWSDYNNDKYPDVAYCGRTSSYSYYTRVYRNNGSGSYTDINAGLPAATLLLWEDFNNDGKPDLFLSGKDSSNIPFTRIARNNGDNTFTIYDAGIVGENGISVACGDYNNDGYPDVATNSGKIYKNNGLGYFTDIGASISGTSSSVTWVDYNNDGFIDLVMPVYNYSPTTNIYRNIGGTDNFTGFIANIPTLSDMASAWCDYNNDGFPDVSVIGVDGAYQRVTQIFNNLGDGTFTLATSLRGLHFPSVAWGDYDNDGYMDIIIAGGTLSGYPENPYTIVYRNNGDGLFSEVNQALPGVTSGFLTWIDENNDGFLDISIVGNTDYDGNIFMIFRSNGYKTLTEVRTGLPNMQECYIDTGDFNNNGVTDIAFTGKNEYGTNFSKIFKTTNAINYIDINAGLTALSEGIISWGDYNNDGFIDIALTGDLSSGSGRCTKIFRNNGDESFSDIAISVPGLQFSFIDWGDYNNDGFQDIAVCGSSGTGDITRIYRNNGDGTFSDIIAELPGVCNGSLAWGDYNNDGLLDLVIAGICFEADDYAICRLYENNGDDTFTDTNIIFPPLGIILDRVIVSWCDYNNDGYLDFTIAGEALEGPSFGPICDLYKNLGNGYFTSGYFDFPGVKKPALAWGDFDGDGYLDLAIAGKTELGTLCRIYLQNPDGTFIDMDAGLPGLGPWYAALYAYGDVVWFDQDGDGDLDLLISGGSSEVGPTTRLYRNGILFPRTRPTPPANLSAAVSGTTPYFVAFSWSPATDAETPSDGLNYNLHVESTSPAAIIVSSMSDVSDPPSPTSGFRRVVRIGNAGLKTNDGTGKRTWTLKDISSGDYRARVQAIDTSFQGGEWSEWLYFSVP